MISENNIHDICHANFRPSGGKIGIFSLSSGQFDKLFNI